MEARVGIEPTHKGFADLSLTTWVPRLNFCSIANFLRRCKARSGVLQRRLPGDYFAGAGCSICASRKKRADSSGGVGLM
jgi:hypothetical protein